MRYGILLLTLIILSDSFSSVFAQSMYQFKRKDSNVRSRNMDTYTNKSSVISEDSQNIKSTPKIRFRYLYGTFNSDSQEATRSTSSIIWDGLGIGQSVFKYNAGISDDTIDLENTSIDLSYTFGDEYTFTLGSSAVYSGKFIGTTSDGQKYNSTNVFGYGHFSIFGVEYGIFEILLGYQFMKYAYLDLESESTAIYWSSFNDSGSLYLLGIGIVF